MAGRDARIARVNRSIRLFRRADKPIRLITHNLLLTIAA